MTSAQPGIPPAGLGLSTQVFPHIEIRLAGRRGRLGQTQARATSCGRSRAKPSKARNRTTVDQVRGWRVGWHHAPSEWVSAL